MTAKVLYLVPRLEVTGGVLLSPTNPPDADALGEVPDLSTAPDSFELKARIDRMRTASIHVIDQEDKIGNVDMARAVHVGQQ